MGLSPPKRPAQEVNFYWGHVIVELGSFEFSSILSFKDTWSQWGHLVSCMIIVFSCLQITRSDIRPHVKWAVNLVIAAGNLIFLRGLCRCVWVNIPSLVPQRVVNLGGLVWFVLFNDTWSQKGHSVSCMTILFISKCKSADRTSGRT